MVSKENELCSLTGKSALHVVWLALRTLLAGCLCLTLSACDGQGVSWFGKKEVVLGVTVYCYMQRPIFDVTLNHRDVGVAGAFGGGGGGIMVGVPIPLGKQELSWRLDGPKGMARNGETVQAKNQLVITKKMIPTDAQYMGIHIYPDETAEFTFSPLPADPSDRGLKLYEERQRGL